VLLLSAAVVINGSLHVTVNIESLNEPTVVSTLKKFMDEERMEAWIQEVVDNEMTILPLGHPGLFDMCETGPVILPKRTQQMWDEVMREDAASVLVRGNSGVGKSRSMVYVLKKLLEARKRLVLWFDVKQKQGTAFVLDGDTGQTYSVWRCMNCEVSSMSAFDFDPHTGEALSDCYCLVDPNRGNEGLPSSAGGKFRVASSPHPNRYHEWAKTKGRAQHYFMAPWSLQDLLCASPLMGVKLTAEDITDRYYDFGGIPRCVFASTPHDDYNCQDASVNHFASTPDVLKALNEPAQAVFAMESQKSEMARAGYIYAFWPKADAFGRPFGDANVKIISERARIALLKRFVKGMDDMVACRQLCESAMIGWNFEEWFFDLLTSGEFTCNQTYLCGVEPEEPLNSKKSFGKLKVRKQQHEQKNSHADFLAIVAGADRKEDTAFKPDAPNLPFMDLALNLWRIFQTFVREDGMHSAKQWDKVVAAQEMQNKKMNRKKNETGILYFATPSCLFDKLKGVLKKDRAVLAKFTVVGLAIAAEHFDDKFHSKPVSEAGQSASGSPPGQKRARPLRR
jgi:hypothetical protein